MHPLKTSVFQKHIFVFQCNQTVKVVRFIDNQHEVDTVYGARTLRTVVIGDETGIIKVPLWGEKIALLETQKSYKLTNLHTRTYIGALQVNLTSSSSITQALEVAAVEDLTSLDSIQTITGTVQRCVIQSMRKCVQCNKNIDIDNESTASTVRCTNCKTKQRLPDLQIKRLLKFEIKDTAKINHKFVMFSDALA